MSGFAGTQNKRLPGPKPAGRPNHNTTMTNLTQLRTRWCWRGWQRMMKPTSNTVLINWEQGAADQRRCWRRREKGGGWKEKEGKAIIDCSVCVHNVRRMTRGERVEGGVRPAGSNWSLVAPLRTSQPATTEICTILHNSLLQLLTLYPTHPPRINTSRADWNSKVSADATGIDGDGQEGDGGCGSPEPNKRQMLNHLAALN